MVKVDSGPAFEARVFDLAAAVAGVPANSRDKRTHAGFGARQRSPLQNMCSIYLVCVDG